MKWIIPALIFLVIIGSAQAYFISDNVPFTLSTSQTTYFIRDHVPNETVLHPEKIVVDGTHIQMEPDAGTANVTIQQLNSTSQNYIIQNSTPDMNMSVNTSNWSAGGTVEAYTNDSAVSNSTVNATGWINMVFNDVSDTTSTKFTLILIVTLPPAIVPFPLPSGLMIEEDNLRFNIANGKLEVYIVI